MIQWGRVRTGFFLIPRTAEGKADGMLQISHVYKRYRTGELVQEALNDVTLNFRDSEFVAILGPSGSGKTTLLNVVGGLDRADGGELLIDGVSTKRYRDKDWDAYRNHTVGFVFQSYHLIPHLSVLANVELALTIGGASRAERRKRAKKALADVGLGDQGHKKPSQLSGGQMQRVAIARALVNDPSVLLADEPTGALDSETGIQVMELLKKVAAHRLVVMVTHNAALAEAYATRIVYLKDGKIERDTDPFDPGEKAAGNALPGKAKMSFGTALSLSFNNLRVKKGRTLLTAFAGSIVIIVIALILSLSNGVNSYIADIQRDTMASYPITIESQAIDLNGLIGTRDKTIQEMTDEDRRAEYRARTAVYAGFARREAEQSMSSGIRTNNLTAFKQYLDDPNSEIHRYLAKNGAVYAYDVRFQAYSRDASGALINSGAALPGEETGGFSSLFGSMSAMRAMMGYDTAGAENFSELPAGADGTGVSRVIKDNYDLLYGAWPEKEDECVLVLNMNNAISAEVLYQLGLITSADYEAGVAQIESGAGTPELTVDYAAVCAHEYYILPQAEFYRAGENGVFSNIGSDPQQVEQLMADALVVSPTAVVRPKDGAETMTVSPGIAYTAQMTQRVIERTAASAAVAAQEKTPETNILTGIRFTASTDAEKAEDAIKYVQGLGVSDKASLYTMILYSGAMESGRVTGGAMMSGMSMMSGGLSMAEGVMAAAMDNWLKNTPDEKTLVSLYDRYVGGSSYLGNMDTLGRVSYDTPSSISLYTESFEFKDGVSAAINRYNETASPENQITYTDYVALLTSSITTIVNAISYVLIAFVAVSLIVSCIMIGIVTRISVLERTREIGVLRALGASKRGISQVFNAETFIVGLCAGVMGVGVSMLLDIPINLIVRQLVGSKTITASLPLTAAALLVVISILITVLGGLIPARKAAKMDPVAALRTE